MGQKQRGRRPARVTRPRHTAAGTGLCEPPPVATPHPQRLSRPHSTGHGDVTGVGTSTHHNWRPIGDCGVCHRHLGVRTGAYTATGIPEDNRRSHAPKRTGQRGDPIAAVRTREQVWCTHAVCRRRGAARPTRTLECGAPAPGRAPGSGRFELLLLLKGMAGVLDSKLFSDVFGALADEERPPRAKFLLSSLASRTTIGTVIVYLDERRTPRLRSAPSNSHTALPARRQADLPQMRPRTAMSTSTPLSAPPHLMQADAPRV